MLHAPSTNRGGFLATCKQSEKPARHINDVIVRQSVQKKNMQPTEGAVVNKDLFKMAEKSRTRGTDDETSDMSEEMSDSPVALSQVKSWSEISPSICLI